MFDFNNRARPESYALMDYIKAGDVGTINSKKLKPEVDSPHWYPRIRWSGSRTKSCLEVVR